MAFLFSCFYNASEHISVIRHYMMEVWGHHLVSAIFL